MIDLHTHSTFSDGSLTPEELVAEGRRIGLRALGLTDHDCTDGLERFMRACLATTGQDHHVEPVPGVEISADVPRGTLHVLGYFVDTQHDELRGVLEQIRNGRAIRNQKILRRLNELGVALTWEEVERCAGEEVVGRPHFARAMVTRGHVKTTQEAFDRYLAKGKPAYVDRFRLSPADSIAVITRAGGLAVLAHPFTLDLTRQALVSFVKEMKGYGLRGIEAYYSEHTAGQTAEYLDVAHECGLIVTGGSDFHGEANKAISLGYGFGSLRVPDELLDDILRFRDGRGTRTSGK